MLYQITAGEGDQETIIFDDITELDVRVFAETLNHQINWKKQCREASFEDLKQALKSNGYNVIEKK